MTSDTIVNLTPHSSGLLSYVPFAPGLLASLVVGQRTAPKRQSLPKTPEDYGMAYRSIDIDSSDGIRLSAWEIPAPSATRLAIVNHPLLCNRYGSVEGMDGVSVEFLPMVKHLHDAGFSVITYDQRGQGESDGGLAKTRQQQDAPVGAGAVEWQDLVGVMRYVAQSDLAGLDIALVTHCMGANAALAAWRNAPGLFEQHPVKAFVAIQPTLSYNMMARLTKQKLGVDLASRIESIQKERFGFGFADALDCIGSVTAPMLFVQVKNDTYTMDAGTGVNDVQVIADRCPTPSELIWIGPDQEPPFGSGKRFEGYGYFNQHPQPLIAFLERHMA